MPEAMPRGPLLVDTIQGLIGETVYDPYGRVLGRLVSFESDVDGTVQRIVVENEYKEITFLPSENIEIKDGRIVAWPEWKVLANKVIESYQRAIRRLKGLEEMYSRGEIPGAVYHEFRKKLNASLDKLKEETKQLRSMITQRLHEIEDSNLKLDRAITSLKVSYLAGEIGEKAYKSAIERLRSAKESNTREAEDLKATRSRVDSLESGAISSIKTPAKQEKPEEKKEEPAPGIEGIKPIPVKLIEG